MAWTKASLRLTLGTGEYTETGSEKTKSKSFSNLKQNASEENCRAVAEAIESVQQYTLMGVTRVDYTEI